MNQPPKMISTKDSGSFNDQLNSLYVLSKKLKAYEESVEDNDIKMTLIAQLKIIIVNYWGV